MPCATTVFVTDAVRRRRFVGELPGNDELFASRFGAHLLSQGITMVLFPMTVVPSRERGAQP